MEQVNCTVCQKSLDNDIQRTARSARRFLDALAVYDQKKQHIKNNNNCLLRPWKLAKLRMNKPAPELPTYRICTMKGVQMTLCDPCYLHACVEGFRKHEWQEVRRTVGIESDVSSETNSQASTV